MRAGTQGKGADYFEQPSQSIEREQKVAGLGYDCPLPPNMRLVHEPRCGDSELERECGHRGVGRDRGPGLIGGDEREGDGGWEQGAEAEAEG